MLFWRFIFLIFLFSLNFKFIRLRIGNRFRYKIIVCDFERRRYFFFSCEDVYLREVVFLLNNMIVLFLIGLGYFYCCFVVFLFFLDNDYMKL